MTRRHRVQWAEAAATDLEELVSYIAVDAPINAHKVLARLKGKADTLELSPLRGRVVPELRQYGIRTYRELLVKPYRIVYRVAEKTVYVLAVCDGRRDLEDMLLERLLRG